MAERLRTCPIAGCEAQHPRTLAMCSAHWREVPRELQRALYVAYRGGSIGDHLQALENAQAAVERREAEILP